MPSMLLVAHEVQKKDKLGNRAPELQKVSKKVFCLEKLRLGQMIVVFCKCFREQTLGKGKEKLT